MSPTAATGSPDTAKSTAPHSPPLTSPAENTPSYSSRDTKSPPAAAPEVGSSSRATSPQSRPPPESFQKTPAVCLTPWLRSSTRMWMRQIVLPQQILPVIIPVRRPHHTMNMLLRWLGRIGRKPRQIRRPLVVEFNQNHRTLYPVVERAVRLRAA